MGMKSSTISKVLETMGSLNKYHYGFREYDPEIGRWNRVDPLYYQTPGQSPYNFVSNNPINLYDVAGLLSDAILKALAYALYEEGDSLDDLVNKMLDAINSGFSESSVNGRTGGGLVAARLTSEQFRRYLEYLGYDVRQGNNNLEGGDTEPIEIVASKPHYVLVGLGFDNFNFADNIKTEDVNLAEKIFGPKAKPTDSWLWRAFRGTGNIKEDIFNASMLSLTIPVATIGAAEATAYIVAEAPYLAAGWQAASAEMYSGWATITKTGNLIVNAIKTQIIATTIEALNRYYANATNIHDASNIYIAGLFGLNYKPVTKYGYYGKFIGILTKKFIRSFISSK